MSPKGIPSFSVLKSSSLRVKSVRGGAFSYFPRFVRSANRYGVAPTFRTFNIGFRVARTLR